MNWKAKKELCFVVQRYGEEMGGGAEALCASYVERLKDDFDITVVTSCAKDYNTWRNVYPAGYETIGGVKVHRFSTRTERDPEESARLTLEVYGDQYHDLELSAKWLLSIGPDCPGIIRFIRDHEDRFDLFIFFGYLYYQTTFGLPLVPHKAVLIPTAHDEDPINKCNYFGSLFNMPAGIIYLTREERAFVQKKFLNGHIPSMVAGAGADIPDLSAAKPDAGLPENPYIVYIGRIDDTKDCSLLFRSFIEYKRRYKDDTKLVLLGERYMEIPERDDILEMGFVSEEQKFIILKGAAAMALPSKAESLSIVTLEAMALGVPVLLRKSSDVLDGHVKRSGAGFGFDDEADFADALHALRADDALAKKMGKNGKEYIQKHYRWDIIMDGIKSFIKDIMEERT